MLITCNCVVAIHMVEKIESRFNRFGTAPKTILTLILTMSWILEETCNWGLPILLTNILYWKKVLGSRGIITVTLHKSGLWWVWIGPDCFIAFLWDASNGIFGINSLQSLCFLPNPSSLPPMFKCRVKSNWYHTNPHGASCGQLQ